MHTPTRRQFFAAATAAGLAAWKGFSPARALETLDRPEIETAMLSITAPGVWFGDAGEARRLAREMNEYAAARLVGDPRRARACGVLMPWRCSGRRSFPDSHTAPTIGGGRTDERQ